MNEFCAISAARAATAGMLLAGAAVTGCTSSSAAADQWVVTLDESLAGPSFTGRVIVMYITGQGRTWDRRIPLQGPFLDHPQPIASIAVEDWDGRAPLELSDANAVVFGGPLDEFQGRVRAQALLHANPERPRADAGPGSVYSTIVSVELDRNRADRVEIALNSPIVKQSVFRSNPNLELVEWRSELLSDRLGRDVVHRAAVALPADYDSRESWPTVYIIPDRNERITGADEYASMLRTPGIEDIAPRAVYIMLDARTAYGHHGFVDSELHGPRATALVQEFIPHLESTYKLQPTPDARLLNGFALGGWSAIWLQLHHADVFGGCWAAAPTPLDFHALQTVDLYHDENVFRNDSGGSRYAYRTPGREVDQMIPSMTVQQMVQMERALDPTGRSGGLWQTLTAIYSPVDAQTGRTKPPIQPLTGAKLDAADHWAAYDVAKLVQEQWETYGAIALNRLHIFCGELDSYYFDRATHRFAELLQRKRTADAPAAGSIVFTEGATHENLLRYVFDDINEQMRSHLQSHGYDQ